MAYEPAAHSSYHDLDTKPLCIGIQEHYPFEPMQENTATTHLPQFCSSNDQQTHYAQYDDLDMSDYTTNNKHPFWSFNASQNNTSAPECGIIHLEHSASSLEPIPCGVQPYWPCTDDSKNSCTSQTMNPFSFFDSFYPISVSQMNKTDPLRTSEKTDSSLTTMSFEAASNREWSPPPILKPMTPITLPDFTGDLANSSIAVADESSVPTSPSQPLRNFSIGMNLPTPSTVKHKDQKGYVKKINNHHIRGTYRKKISADEKANLLLFIRIADFSLSRHEAIEIIAERQTRAGFHPSPVYQIENALKEQKRKYKLSNAASN